MHVISDSCEHYFFHAICLMLGSWSIGQLLHIDMMAMFLLTKPCSLRGHLDLGIQQQSNLSKLSQLRRDWGGPTNSNLCVVEVVYVCNFIGQINLIKACSGWDSYCDPPITMCVKPTRSQSASIQP